MKSIGIYLRCSTDRQDLASQETAVQAWLDGLQVNRRPSKILFFKDEGISGKTLRRPGFQAMLAAAQSGKIDTIVCYRLDRFSRNATTAIRLILNLDEAGVAFVSVTQPVLNLGHENPFRRTMLAAFAEIAEIERETIVARVKAGLQAAKKRGTKLGAPIKATKLKADQVRTLRAAGKSIRQVAQELKLSVGTVHNLIKEV